MSIVNSVLICLGIELAFYLDLIPNNKKYIQKFFNSNLDMAIISLDGKTKYTTCSFKVIPNFILDDIKNNIGSLRYNEKYDFWTLPKESDIITSSCAHFKNKSIKTIIRKILKKWKLPKGCKISIWDRTTEWKLLTK